MKGENRKSLRKRKVGITTLLQIGVILAMLTISVGAQAAGTQYVVNYGENNAEVINTITNAGGTIVANYPQIGIVVAKSENPDFASTISANQNFKQVVHDVEVKWLPDINVDEANLKSLDIPQPSISSSPFGAAFLPLQWNIFVTKTDQAWSITQGDPAVKVAVLDTGIDSFHPDLIGRVDAAQSTSFITEPSECADSVPPVSFGAPIWQDRGFHGTHVAGIISTNNIGTAGVAPNVRLRAVKVLNCFGSGTFGSMIQGIIYAADTGNNVISMSLGAYFPKNGGPGPGGLGQLVAVLNKAVNYAESKGVLVVSAAGNAGIDLNKDKNNIEVPCQSGSGMCVGSTTRSDALSTFSNHGLSEPQIVAPGGGLPITPFPTTAFNELIGAPCNSRSVFLPFCSSGTWYLFIAGTSMATPQVSGAAALADSIAPKGPGSLSVGQLRNKLLQGADDLGKKGVDDIYSHGRLNTLGTVAQ